MATSKADFSRKQNPPESNSATNLNLPLPLAASAGISCTRRTAVTTEVVSGISTSASAVNDIKRAGNFGVPFLDLTAFDFNCCPEQVIDLKLIRKYRVLPLFRRSKRLLLAIADPANNSSLSDIKFHTGLVIDVVLVSATLLDFAIINYISRLEASQPLIQSWNDQQLESIHLETVVPLDSEDTAADEAPIVRFVNKLLLDAITNNASDIHIEPYESTFRVRFRIDGVLQEITRPPLRLAGRIVARIKVMAQLDISEKRIPQDGRIRIRQARHRTVDFRVNILPVMWGEKVTLRLLDPAIARLGIDALGFSLDQKLLFLNALQRSQGLILVTGPTGSGKSVTLYTGLNILNSRERNIATAEDPVELNIDGLNQVSVNIKSGFSFAAALRAFLRQDPDVIMIGEVRDPETADTALKAAQTGHLVLSTLHTNSAIATISRLLDMGIAPYNLATSISLIVAQRLARRLCPHCKESVNVSEKILTEAGFQPGQVTDSKLYRAGTCEKCKGGHKGRVGIFEVVPITANLSRSIIAGASPDELGELAKAAGFCSLRDAALIQVAKGLISLDEANRLV